MTLREEMVLAHHLYIQHRDKYQDTKQSSDYALMVNAYKDYFNKARRVRFQEKVYGPSKAFGVKQ